MKLEILYGPAGTGKTGALLQAARLRAIGEAGALPADTWLVVPDQASFVMERRVLDTLGDRDGSRVRVFSINRLARHILSETGGSPRPFLDASGRDILVYRVIRSLGDRLPLFSDAIRRGGFTKVAGDLVAEFKRYHIPPEQLRAAARAAGDARLSVKLGELALIGEAIQTAMDERGYLDGEDRLRMVAERLGDVPGIGRIHLALDQFQRLSPVQVQLVAACIRQMASVTVSLRLAEGPAVFGDGTAVFAPDAQLRGQSTRRMAQALLDAAASLGAPVVQACTAGVDLRHRPDSGLAFLARRLSLPDRKVFRGCPDDLRLAVHADPEAEVHACAARLVALCRDGGCRFRDLAVLVPDVSEYAGAVRRIFRLHGIPFFMDRKESLAGNPVSVALLAVFDVLRGGWRHDDVFRLLKSGLLPVEREVVDRLENHALATGLRGRRLWCERPIGDESLETARRVLVEPLTAFRLLVRGPVPARHALEAYLALLLDWRLPQAVSTRARQMADEGRLEQAGHMRQIWQSACSLMDQMLELCGDGTLTLTELHGMLQTGLEGGSTGIIPPSLDEVFVGTPSRSQLSEVRHLFVLGAVEGWIPSAPGGQGLLTDHDRRTLLQCGVELAPDTRSVSLERRDELDTVLAGPSEGLWLSRPVADGEGKALLPSSLLDDLRHLFPDLREGWEDAGTEVWPAAVAQATTPGALLACLAPLLREAEAGDALPRGLLALAARDPEAAARIAALEDGLAWRNRAALSPQWLRERYGTVLTGSISSMELYRRCPFSWFGRHAARLSERETAGLRDVGFGLLMHGVLDDVLAQVEAMGGWDALEPDALPPLVDQAVRKGVASGTGISPLHPGLSTWFAARLGKAALTAAERVFRQVRDGSFRPVGHELGFGGNGPFPPYILALPDGGAMRLVGRLDRLDVHDAPEGRYVRVVDYKSGDRTLSLADIANGLSMQLPAYLAVALSSMRQDSGQVLPAGIFHMRLEPPDIRKQAGDAQGAEADRQKRMRLTGYVLDDAQVLGAMDHQLAKTGASTILKASLNRDGTISSRTKTLSAQGFEQLGGMIGETIGRLGAALMSGEIPVRPVRMQGLKACDQCPYGRVCRFEPGLGGAVWDRPPLCDEKQVRAMLEGEDAHEMDR